MKSRILLRELTAYLAEESEGYALPAPESAPEGAPAMEREAPPRIFLHGLPDEPGEETYPFIVLRWVEGSIEAEEVRTLAQETLALILGVYAPKDMAQAGMLLAELLDAVRQSLWRRPLLAQMFELVQPLRAAVPGPKDRWNQYHMATVEVTYNYVLPSRGPGKEAG